MKAFTLLVIFFLSFASAQVSDEEWKKIKSLFEQDFAKGTPEAQERGIQLLAKADRMEASQICFNLLAVPPDQQTLNLERQKESLLPKWFKERERVTEIAKKNLGMVPANELDRLNKIDAEIQKINQAIEATTLTYFAAGAALKKVKNEEHANFLLEKGGDHKNWRVQVASIEAFQVVPYDPQKLLEFLKKALQNKEPMVRSSACDTLAVKQLHEGLDALYPLLLDEAWQVRVASLKAIGTLKHEKSIPILIEQLEKEDGRLKQDVENALQQITGKTFHTNIALWRSWHKLHPDFSVVKNISKTAEKTPDDTHNKTPKNTPNENPTPQEKGKAAATYYGIDTYSKRLIFILDVSGSMIEPLRTGDETKLDGAKKELKFAITGLSEDAEFLLMTYSDTVQFWQNKLVKASKRNKELAHRFIDTQKPDGGTNIYDALQQAFNLAGRGSFDKSYKVSVDTVFFLTDGEPSAGTMVEPEKILKSVQEWNKLRKIQIHTIGLGQHAKKFMEQLAIDNNGQYVYR